MSQIQPLRIQKNAAANSPIKANGGVMPRPLSELGPMERRRNSPSYSQNTKKMIFSGESSPFESSPLASNSPRLYWQSRDPASPNRLSTENYSQSERETSPSPAKRSSIENLKRASRVKNSNMFAREHKQEYDPSSTPTIERPLASGRPLSLQAQGNLYGGKGLDGLFKGNGQDKSTIPFYSPARSSDKVNAAPEPQKSPSKDQLSPGKSSLSSRSRYAQAQAFDPENGIWSEDEESIANDDLPPGKSPRHFKSVTFDAAPPQINEYEMTTPVPSSVASGSRDSSYDSAEGEEDESFERDFSVDRDDSFDASLEDTDKTPVVLPEDWRSMSPGSANDHLATSVEDPFEGKQSSPAPTTKPTSAIDARLSPSRTDSTNSNGERRPLPPLPALGKPIFPRARSDSNNSLSAIAERISNSPRLLPSPPRPASISKSEIQGMGGCSMPIEDRIRLMMLHVNEQPKTQGDGQRERRLRRAGTREKSEEPGFADKDSNIKIHEDEDVADVEEYKLPPRISRESILRKVKSKAQLAGHSDSDFDYVSPSLGSSPDRIQLSRLDPDTPLPSLEDRTDVEAVVESVVIKQEDDGEEKRLDIYAVPDVYTHYLQAESQTTANEDGQPYTAYVSNPRNQTDDDDASHYSNDSRGDFRQEPQSHSATEDEGPLTPRPQSPAHSKIDLESRASQRMSLPQFAYMLGDDDFGFGLQPYMTPSPPLSEEPSKIQREPLRLLAELSEHTLTPEEQLYPPTFPSYGSDANDEPKTPDSVVHHPIANAAPADTPGIPDPAATIKAPGSKLKTRPSVSPADLVEMAETRRQVSIQLPAITAIPEQDQDEDNPSLSYEPNSPMKETSIEANTASDIPVGDLVKQIKRKSSLVQLEIPVEDLDEGLSFGLDREFDRVIEAQKVAFNLSTPETETVPSSLGRYDHTAEQEYRLLNENIANRPVRTQKGYLMRQNTKMVVASSASHDSAPDVANLSGPHARGTRSAGNSPRKASHTQTWTTEPWNGKIRRKSLRQASSSPQKIYPNGPVPPLPGQSSNVTSGLDSVAENETAHSIEQEEDDSERGRLFVKVVGVKELDLPLPEGERSYFALTLDNGLHCVTTAWLELGKYAAIGQEFELVVLNDLEFQLTLQTKLEEPKARAVVESPTKTPKVPKPSTFSRVFTSPRKRKELEMKQQEEAQRAAKQKRVDLQASRRTIQPTAWDLLHSLVAKDGSFARSYVCLKDHEPRAYGRPYTVDVPCFNEWATEEVQNSSSMKSKKGPIGGSTQRKAPYKIGKLELQLLFVPKPKDAKENDMPKSMNACVRELQEAENVTLKTWEGHLSQQGGDCPYWRRRFFTLDGPKLTAYHETTRQPRATINLVKASKLIDDKSSLIQKEVSGKGGSRRRSAFAADEEGYMFVEEGFRIRFANGETIDFYADSAAEKDGWMKALADVVGKETKKASTWTELVLTKEKSAAQRAARSEKGQLKAQPSMKSAPPTPARQSSQANKNAPAPVEKDARHLNGMAEQRRQKTRSMIF